MTTVTTGRGATFGSAQKSELEQLYHLISVLIGSVAYGIYLPLFVLGVPIIAKRTTRSSASTFLVGSVLIFLFTTIYIIIAIYRLVFAYGKQITKPELPIVYYYQTRSQWDGFTQSFMINIGTWTADVMVIYRCFLIWNCSYLVILLPCSLLCLSICVGIYTMTFTLNPSLITLAQVTPFYSIPFPLNISKYALSTGLIAYRIHRQHRENRAIGLQAYRDNIALVRVTRVVIESAALYLLQQITMLVMYSLKHPAVVLLYDTLLPTIGIVFLLMALRTQPKQTPGGIRSELIILPNLASGTGTGTRELTVLNSHGGMDEVTNNNEAEESHKEGEKDICSGPKGGWSSCH
ncbi:hypothetical protein FA15DRAFT_709475 [Coprinopsis marcescibilis]|uniref:Uncharacterized protein n=1 Tax=Coprinopsis marcescibilis TaxID=230819 RepID=A0A5C3KGG6_COPMA|nr:hypothetical protein FA15DRAFT_709475 [Coprinopsis marcescibilis]